MAITFDVTFHPAWRDRDPPGPEYISVLKGAFYEARVCSDADLRCTVLNMLEM